MYNLTPEALKKGQGGQEEKKGGNKRADGWQVGWGFGVAELRIWPSLVELVKQGP